MTPADSGWVKCWRCGCWRRPEGVTPSGRVHVTGHATDVHLVAWACADASLCSRLAGVGQGQLDADVGGPGPDAQPGDAA